VGLLLSGFLVLLSSGFLLFVQVISLDLLDLGFVDGFNQDSLVLELVTLACLVEFVIDVLVNLLGSSVFSQQSSQDSLSSDPKEIGCFRPWRRKKEIMARPQ